MCVCVCGGTVVLPLSMFDLKIKDTFCLLVDEFTEIVPSTFKRFIDHHLGLFVRVKSAFFILYF